MIQAKAFCNERACPMRLVLAVLSYLAILILAAFFIRIWNNENNLASTLLCFKAVNCIY